MARPKLLDLYCKAGGAARGYHDAGFDVTGVDIEPQPNYPYTFVQADALDYLAQYGYRFDAVHASPPCQAHSWAARRWQNSGERDYIDLLPHTRFLLDCLGKPYVIENVVGAPLRNPLMLCGTMFGLRVFRHRLFESPLMLFAPGARCSHKNRRVGFHDDGFVTVAGHGGEGPASLRVWQKAMGIDWMTKDEMTQAIPPAYTRWIGAQLMTYVLAERVAVARRRLSQPFTPDMFATIE